MSSILDYCAEKLKEGATMENKKLPTRKLTAEVFNRVDCPPWARFAGVDKEGFAAWLSHRPYWTGTGFEFNTYEGHKVKLQSIPGKWDASEWESSLVEREDTAARIAELEAENRRLRQLCRKQNLDGYCF